MWSSASRVSICSAGMFTAAGRCARPNAAASRVSTGVTAPPASSCANSAGFTAPAARGRNGSSISPIFFFRIAPTTASWMRPSATTMNVGTLCTRSCCAMTGALSTSIFTTLALPCISCANASTSGAMALQGWHQSAVNSMSTGSSLRSTCCSKSRSVTYGTLPAPALPLGAGSPPPAPAPLPPKPPRIVMCVGDLYARGGGRRGGHVRVARAHSWRPTASASLDRWSPAPIGGRHVEGHARRWMAKLEDTDPSSPEAIRGQASTEPAAPPGAPQVSTDPGIGPPSRPPIPATSAVQPKKDSVELLLDGMAGPQLDRPKTTPQSDGQAAASYHAQHGVRPAHTSPDLEPKVVVERPALPKTMKVDRAVVQQAIEMADARRRAQDATVVAPQRVAPRVIVAIVAGLVVVLGLFVVARLIVMRSGTTAATPTRPAVVTVVATATAPATASAVATAAAPAPASET